MTTYSHYITHNIDEHHCKENVSEKCSMKNVVVQ